jgi:hypothetical protein
MMDDNGDVRPPTQPSGRRCPYAIAFAATYLGAVAVACLRLGPRTREFWVLAIVAAVPGVVAFLSGLPRVLRNPIPPLIGFHLIVYPLLATLTMGGLGVLWVFVLCALTGG